MRTFVLGDVHGCYRGLVQVLQRSKFDKERDLLITLGDICDGYSEVYECVEELLGCKNRIDIRGNHDDPFVEFFHSGIHPWGWAQGGDGTVQSYGRHSAAEVHYQPRYNGGNSTLLTNLNPEDVPPSHQQFFRGQHYYYVDDQNRLFVHGGFDRSASIRGQDKELLLWDRSLWMKGMSNRGMKVHTVDDFTEIFLGHTATVNWKTDQPMQCVHIWNVDTGAGFAGKLTIMDVETKEFWQSDRAEDLYPDDYGRRRR